MHSDSHLTRVSWENVHSGMYLLMDMTSQSRRKNTIATTSAIILFASSPDISLAAAHIINQIIALASDSLA